MWRISDGEDRLRRQPRPGPELKHEGEVREASFSPDGRRVVTASYDKTARVWDVATGEPVSEPLRHADSVYDAVFGPDGHRVVTASKDKTVRVWDCTARQAIPEPLLHDGRVVSTALDEDGSHLVTLAADHRARVWKLASAELLHTLPGSDLKDENIVASMLSGGGQWTTLSDDRKVRRWNAVTKVSSEGSLPSAEPIKEARFSSDASRLVTLEEDGKLRLWDITSEKLIRELGTIEESASDQDRSSLNAVYSPDGRHLLRWRVEKEEKEEKENAGAPEGQVTTIAEVWDAATAKKSGKPIRHEGLVRVATLSPDGRRIVTSRVRESEEQDETASSDTAAQVWDVETGELIGTLPHGNNIRSVAFSPDGALLVTGSGDNTARVWDVETSLPVSGPLNHNERVDKVAFSSDGRRVVTASRDNTARVWDARTGLPMSAPFRHRRDVSYAVFSPRGRRLVTATSAEVRVWTVLVNRTEEEKEREEGYRVAELAEAVSGYEITAEGALARWGTRCNGLTTYRRP